MLRQGAAILRVAGKVAGLASLSRELSGNQAAKGYATTSNTTTTTTKGGKEEDSGQVAELKAALEVARREKEEVLALLSSALGGTQGLQEQEQELREREEGELQQQQQQRRQRRRGQRQPRM